MNKRRRVYEGKAKVLYEGPEPGTLIQHFKDDATAFNNKKHALIEGKGVLNNRISEYIFHAARRDRRADALHAAASTCASSSSARSRSSRSRSWCATSPPARWRPASGWRRASRCRARSSSSTTRTTRSATRWSREEHITAFGWATRRRSTRSWQLALRINDFLVGLFLGIGIRLVDFKVEFGRLWENEQMRIVLADEISPDCCRLWDVVSSEKLDKDRFRRDLGGVLEAYQEVAKRLGVLTEGRPPKGAGPVLVASNPNGKPN